MVVNLWLISSCDATKEFDSIHFTLLHFFLATFHSVDTLSSSEEFGNQVYVDRTFALAIAQSLADYGFWNTQLICHTENRDLSIAHYDAFYGYNIFVAGCCRLPTTFQRIFEVTH